MGEKTGVFRSAKRQAECCLLEKFNKQLGGINGKNDEVQ